MATVWAVVSALGLVVSSAAIVVVLWALGCYYWWTWRDHPAKPPEGRA